MKILAEGYFDNAKEGHSYDYNVRKELVDSMIDKVFSLRPNWSGDDSNFENSVIILEPYLDGVEEISDDYIDEIKQHLYPYTLSTLRHIEKKLMRYIGSEEEDIYFDQLFSRR